MKYMFYTVINLFSVEQKKGVTVHPNLDCLQHHCYTHIIYVHIHTYIHIY